ncbi:hypothetical protein SK128_016252, partial [Halocaridina rubra]
RQPDVDVVGSRKIHGVASSPSSGGSLYTREKCSRSERPSFFYRNGLFLREKSH